MVLWTAIASVIDCRSATMFSPNECLHFSDMLFRECSYPSTSRMKLEEQEHSRINKTEKLNHRVDVEEPNKVLLLVPVVVVLLVLDVRLLRVVFLSISSVKFLNLSSSSTFSPSAFSTLSSSSVKHFLFFCLFSSLAFRFLY